MLFTQRYNILLCCTYIIFVFIIPFLSYLKLIVMMTYQLLVIHNVRREVKEKAGPAFRNKLVCSVCPQTMVL